MAHMVVCLRTQLFHRWISYHDIKVALAQNVQERGESHNVFYGPLSDATHYLFCFILFINKKPISLNTLSKAELSSC